MDFQPHPPYHYGFCSKKIFFLVLSDLPPGMTIITNGIHLFSLRRIPEDFSQVKNKQLASNYHSSFSWITMNNLMIQSICQSIALIKYIFWIKDMKVRLETIQLLEGNVSGKCLEIGLGDDSVDLTPKAKALFCQQSSVQSRLWFFPQSCMELYCEES